MAYFASMSRKVKTIGLHLLGWLLFVSLVIGFVESSPEADPLGRVSEPAFLLFVFIYVSLFYLNGYVLMPRLYLKQKTALYLMLAFVLLAVVFWLKPYDHLVRMHMHHFGEDRPPRPDRLPPPLHDEPLFQEGPGIRDHGPERRGRMMDIVSVVLFLAVWSVSMAMQLFRQWRSTERRALQAEADRVNAELSFLKAQINPHFLFNTLNNIYSLAITNSAQTPSAILKLSEILHYVTDEVGNDFVPLRREVDCVKNYIELQKLRLTGKVDVLCEVNGNLEGKKIAPLLFMTFIENAFKYGISSHEPCVITIAITAGEESIDFFCRNKIMVRNATEERTGVGIGNVKKRLDYLYPGKYLLNIDTKEVQFSVHLAIRN
ncbi:sensor histidine kinase [Flavisolibacter nicotianae]|uniref:sensor histidine kinase n=1 Tax=Flavisolibacter nicotianae TaxID=2364882 RepID=UPI0013C48340|nr:sensor histidine kinase [Flavisolibacter nicotianae]